PTDRSVVDASMVAAAVYHHGACSTTIGFSGLLNRVVEGVWNGFRSSGSIDGPQSHYRHAISILEPGNFNDGKQGDRPPSSGVRGGFLFAFHFRGDVASSNNEVWGTYKYLFSLHNGILNVDDDDV